LFHALTNMTDMRNYFNASCCGYFRARAARRFALGAILLATLSLPRFADAAGVTIITHGFNGDVTGWVATMANEIPTYPTFPGTNFTPYTVTVTYSNAYLVATTRTNGVAPSASDSGEIIIKLDWSALAGSSTTYSTSNVAWAVVFALMQTNMIAELGGHAPVEYPIHLAGHSRGGSLMSEISRLLGTNGIWVDHLTTLDPHPLNNDGFNDFIVPVVDATAKNTYANVLYADNYWQDLGNGLTDPTGEAVAGAYVRQLTSLRGGYTNSNTFLNDVYEYHSNVHLWYHGTIDRTVPLNYSDDGQLVGIDANMRTNWWVAYEEFGTNAGFLYSLIGGGNRLSFDHPLGIGQPAIIDGFNQWWDLGAGVSSNRTTLASNNGGWPNLIRLDRTATNAVVRGQNMALKFYYQWAMPATSNATLSFYLDGDFNPLNTNDQLVTQMNVPGNGAASVSTGTYNIPLNVAPGTYAVYAKISGGGRSRYLYAPELVTVVAAPPAPVLDISAVGGGLLAIGVNGMAGETIILQGSTNFQNWPPLATNTLTSNRWVYTNSPSAAAQYFRAVVGP
jgi:hypothetical protein